MLQEMEEHDAVEGTGREGLSGQKLSAGVESVHCAGLRHERRGEFEKGDVPAEACRLEGELSCGAAHLQHSSAGGDIAPEPLETSARLGQEFRPEFAAMSEISLRVTGFRLCELDEGGCLLEDQATGRAPGESDRSRQGEHVEALRGAERAAGMCHGFVAAMKS